MDEFVATRVYVEHILDLRITLRYMGVPIKNISYIFGYNKYVVDSSSTPFAKIRKRHIKTYCIIFSQSQGSYCRQDYKILSYS